MPHLKELTAHSLVADTGYPLNWKRGCQVIMRNVRQWFIVCNVFKKNDDTKGATCGARTDYPFGTPEFIPGFSGVRGALSLVFC